MKLKRSDYVFYISRTKCKINCVWRGWMLEQEKPLEFDDFDNLGSIMEVSVTEPLPTDMSFPNVQFTKKFAIEFLRLCDLAQSFGNDVYTKSFLLSRRGYDVIDLVYANSVVYAHKEVPIEPSESQLSGDFVIDFRSFAKVFLLPGPNMLLFSEDNTLYSRVFGGNVFIPVMNVIKDPYEQPDAGKLLSSFVIEGEKLITLFRSFLVLSKTGTRATERAVYFDDNCAYIYSGAVVGQFEGKFTNMVLQNNDIELILKFFSLSKGDIEVEVCENYVVLRTGKDYLMLQRKTLELPQTAKLPIKTNFGVKIDAKTLWEIVKILESIPTNSGVVDFSLTGSGLDIVAPSRLEGKTSRFSILGEEVGSGNDKQIRVSLKLLKNYIAAFSGEILFSFAGGKVIIVGELGSVLIMGLQEK